MNIKTRKQKVNILLFWILFAFLIVATNGFSYKNWDFKTYIYLPFYAYFFYVIMTHKKVLHRNRESMKFSRLIMMMVIVPFLCFISYFSNGDLEWQSHPTTFISMCGSVTFMLYFVLHALQVNEKTLVRLFITAAVCIFFLQVVQQLNPSGALFGIGTNNSDVTQTMSISDNVEQRNGLYRFRISGNLFTILALCYAWVTIQRNLYRANLLSQLCLGKRYDALTPIFLTRPYRTFRVRKRTCYKDRTTWATLDALQRT